MKYFFIATLSLILYCCTDPGYSVRINIDENAKATEDDINSISEYIKKKKYEVVVEKGDDLWKVRSYKIILDDKRFDKFKHKYINFVIEYHISELSAEEKKALKTVEVRIGNNWEGRKPLLKEEIDTLSAIIVDQLTRRINKSDITVTRKFVTPM